MLADNESGGLHLELAFFFLTTKHTQKKKGKEKLGNIFENGRTMQKKIKNTWDRTTTP